MALARYFVLLLLAPTQSFGFYVIQQQNQQQSLQLQQNNQPHQQQHNHKHQQRLEEQLEREREEGDLLYAKQVCNTRDHFMPCACQPTLTATKVHTDGKVVKVMFPEFKCEETINEKRKDEGRIDPGYKCTQLSKSRVLYRDVWYQPIEVEVQYSAGCELRCINEQCHGAPTKNSSGNGGGRKVVLIDK